MSFFNKILAFFGAAGAQVVSNEGKPLSADEQANLANSLEFNALLQDEQQAVIAKQNSEISAQNATIKTLVEQVKAQGEKFAALEASTVNALKAIDEKAAAKSAAVAQEVNKLKGAPIVGNDAEQDANNNLLGDNATANVVTMEGYLKALKSGTKIGA